MAERIPRHRADTDRGAESNQAADPTTALRLLARHVIVAGIFLLGTPALAATHQPSDRMPLAEVTQNHPSIRMPDESRGSGCLVETVPIPVGCPETRNVLDELHRWLALLLPVLVAVGGGLVGLFRWMDQRDREFQAQQLVRAQERRERLANYVIPFALSCDELQSRLYNILEQNGLIVLRDADPQGLYADETLYLISRVFGWQEITLRYYPEPEVYKPIAEMRAAFATDRYGTGAFRLFRNTQTRLGKLTIIQSPSASGPVFESVDQSEFLASLPSSDIGTYPGVTETLTALRNAHGAEDLGQPTLARLVRIQHLLVDLLEYLERQEEWRFSILPMGKRLKARGKGVA